MEYEVNDNTLALVPFSNKTKVIEMDNEYIIDSSPYKILEHSCEYFGSSMQGRLKGSKHMLGSIYKAPIIVEESKNLIFFPTSSPVLDDNMWISLKNVSNYYKGDNNTTKIMFNNDTFLNVKVPYYSIDNQILRASRLESVLKYRKEDKKAKN